MNDEKKEPSIAEVRDAMRYFREHGNELQGEDAPVRGSSEFLELVKYTSVADCVADEFDEKILEDKPEALTIYGYTGKSCSRELKQKLSDKNFGRVKPCDISYENTHIASMLRQYLQLKNGLD